MSTANSVLAFDLGGTRLKSGAVREGVLRALATTEMKGRAAVEMLLESARELAPHHPPAAAGVSVPGIVDCGRVVSLAGKHPGLEGVDLAATLRDELGVPVVVVNDAIAYATGEAVAGAARGHDRAVVVTVGTGIGVGVVEKGAPVGHGPLGGGILGGQIPIATTSEHLDTNGRRGTIEALCSAQRTCDGIDLWRQHLVRALGALAHAHTPSVLVVGGGPLRAPTHLLDGVEERVNKHLYRGYRVAVRRAALGDGAALVGVAHLATRAATA